LCNRLRQIGDNERFTKSINVAFIMFDGIFLGTVCHCCGVCDFTIMALLFNQQ